MIELSSARRHRTWRASRCCGSHFDGTEGLDAAICLEEGHRNRQANRSIDGSGIECMYESEDKQILVFVRLPTQLLHVYVRVYHIIPERSIVGGAKEEDNRGPSSNYRQTLL